MLLFFLCMVAVQAQQTCNVDMIEEHAHFTRVTDQNKSRECWFDLPTGSDLFLDLERYSDIQTLDKQAQLNITFGSTTLNINNAFLQTGSHQCAVPMQTKLEQTIWLWIHFEDNAMTVQISPANTAFFGHCFTVPNVNKPTSMHMVGRTQTGMEQVLRGIHADQPSLQDPGQTVVMRKTIHELERRLHILEQQQERFANNVNQAHRHHLENHRDSMNRHQEHTNVQQEQQGFMRDIGTDMVEIGRASWMMRIGIAAAILAVLAVLYCVCVLQFRQAKLAKFQL